MSKTTDAVEQSTQSTGLVLSKGDVNTSLTATMNIDKQSLVTVAVCDIEKRLKQAVEEIERTSKAHRAKLAQLEKSLQADVEAAVAKKLKPQIEAAAVFYAAVDLPSASSITCNVDTEKVLVTLSLYSSSRKVVNHYNRSADTEERQDELTIQRKFSMAELGAELVASAVAVESLQKTLQTLTDQAMYRRRQLSQMPQYERQAQANIARAMLGNDEQGKILLNAVTADLAEVLALPADLQLAPTVIDV